jgi:hypothetical protein
MSTPTPDQITIVKNNINNIISFNKDLLNQANLKLESAYALLTEANKSDLGLQIGLNFLGSCFKAIGGLVGPGGVFAANFLTGLVSQYATETPPSLNQIYSSLVLRLQTTFNQVDEDLANYYQDPVKNWDKLFSGSFNTPFERVDASGKISDLANCKFPVQTDPEYYTVLNGCIKELDRSIWATLLGGFKITHYIESRNTPWDEPCDSNAIDNSFLRVNKSYYHTWTPIDNTNKHGGHYTTWDRQEYNIGTGAGVFSDGALNDDACNYLFHNYSSDIMNPDGLFERVDVFTKLNIPKEDHYINDGGFKFSTFFRSTYKKTLVQIHSSEPNKTC